MKTTNDDFFKDVRDLAKIIREKKEKNNGTGRKG